MEAVETSTGPATGPVRTRRAALAQERASRALHSPPFWPPLSVPAPRRPLDDATPVPQARPLTRREVLAAERAREAPQTTPDPPVSRREALAQERAPRSAPPRARRRRRARSQGRVLTAGAIAVAAYLSAQAHEQVLRSGLPVMPDPRDGLRHAVLVTALTVLVTVLRAELTAARRTPWAHVVPWLICLVPVLTLVASGLRGSLDVPLEPALVASQPGVAALAVLLVTEVAARRLRRGWTRTGVGVTLAGALTGPAVAVGFGGEGTAQGAAGEALVLQAAVTGMLVGAALLATAHLPARRRVVATTALPFRPGRPRTAWLRPLVPTGPTLALALAPTLLTDPSALPKAQLWNVALVPASGVAAAAAAVLGSHALLMLREQWRDRRDVTDDPPQAWTAAELEALRGEGGWWRTEQTAATLTPARPRRRG